MQGNCDVAQPDLAEHAGPRGALSDRQSAGFLGGTRAGGTRKLTPSKGSGSLSQAGRSGDQRGGPGGDPPALQGRTDAGAGHREEVGDLEEHRPQAIADDAPPKYQRAPKGSIVDAVEPQIRELLEQWPEMPATVIPERIGWDRGLTVLKDRIRDLRPASRAADPASRTVYEPGEIGQCDLWFPPADIPRASARSGGHRCWSWSPATRGGSPRGCCPPGRTAQTVHRKDPLSPLPRGPERNSRRLTCLVPPQRVEAEPRITRDRSEQLKEGLAVFCAPCGFRRAVPSRRGATTDAAACPPAISRARFGSDSTAIRSNGMPVTWWIISDIRSPAYVSTPFIELTTTASGSM